MKDNREFECIFCEKIYSSKSNLSKHHKTKACLSNQQKSDKKISITSVLPDNIPALLTDKEKEDNLSNELKNLSWTKIINPDLANQYYHSQNYLIFGKQVKDKIEIMSTSLSGIQRKIVIRDKNNKSISKPIHIFIYYIYNYNKQGNCNICKSEPSIFNMFSREKHDIDHINNDHEDNRLINLQRLCKPCHAEKTNEQTKKTRKNSSLNSSIPLLCYKKDDEHYIQEFISSTDVENKLGIRRGNVSTSARDFEKNKITWVGCNKNKDNGKFREFDSGGLSNLENFKYVGLVEHFKNH